MFQAKNIKQGTGFTVNISGLKQEQLSTLGLHLNSGCFKTNATGWDNLAAWADYRDPGAGAKKPSTQTILIEARHNVQPSHFETLIKLGIVKAEDG